MGQNPSHPGEHQNSWWIDDVHPQGMVSTVYRYLLVPISSTARSLDEGKRDSLLSPESRNWLIMGKQVSTFSRTMPSPIPVVLTPAFSARPGWYSLGSQALWWIQSHPCKASAMIPCAETHLHKESEVSSIHHPFIIHSSSIHHPFIIHSSSIPNMSKPSNSLVPKRTSVRPHLWALHDDRSGDANPEKKCDAWTTDWVLRLVAKLLISTNMWLYDFIYSDGQSLRTYFGFFFWIFHAFWTF